MDEVLGPGTVASQALEISFTPGCAIIWIEHPRAGTE